VDAFYDELHYLRADEQRPDPAEEDPAPRIHYGPQRVFGYELPDARRQNWRKPHEQSGSPLFSRRDLLSSSSATRSMGKEARNILKATACDTIPHCGMTLARVWNSLFARDLSAIAWNYTARGRAMQRFQLMHFIVVGVGLDATFREDDLSGAKYRIVRVCADPGASLTE
jgi:hypothetical protein